MRPNHIQQGDGLAVLKRVIGYMLHYYRALFILVIGCILVSAVCTVVGATFPQTLIRDYLQPMLEDGSTDFSGLAQDIKQLVCIMALGVVASFSYNRIMVNVSQGTLLRLRNDLFHKMEALPIKYFDTHENLLKSNPIYQEIYESQVKGGGDFDQPA